ncbi:MAG: sulfite exporter TauE/SafE family protein [Shimia sp.]
MRQTPAMDLLGILVDLPALTLGLAVGVALVAGLIKGMVGFAMPLIMVSGLSTVMDPKLAIAGMLFSIVVSNVLQTFREGVPAALGAARGVWRYLLILWIAIALSAQLVAVIPTRAFYFVLGIPVVALSLIQLLGPRLTIPPSQRGWAEWVVGAISGVLGGLAGTWGPTTVLYLLAIDTPKARQIIAQGVIFGTGAIVLLLSHLQSGLLDARTAPLSAALLVPALIGMALGFRMQDALDAVRFRKVTLVVLVVAGLNLVRKGIVG